MPVSFILSACPFESTVPLEPAPVEAIDTSMLGYWYGIVKDGSDFFGIEALDITKHSDSIYSIIRYGKGIKGDMIMPDTAYFTAYTSYVGEDRFMNVVSTVETLKPKGKKGGTVLVKENVYYLARFEKHHDTLTMKAVVENFSPTRKGFRNPAELKEAISGFLDQKQNIFDATYSLSYRKIEKPQPLKPL